LHNRYVSYSDSGGYLIAGAGGLIPAQALDGAAEFGALQGIE